MRRRAWIEGFASAQITKSSGPNGFPSQRPAYSSSTGVAFWRKSGSRGKIHERYRHGLIASLASHRPIVEADASLTPRSTTNRCSSERLKRDSGRP
jgi:hypothetical protein